ncbi:PPM family protein phosphatase [Gammaproteobacteria bacterium]
MPALDIGQVSRLGDRAINQDRVGFFEQEGSMLLVVADGLGGHPRGEIAAEALVECCEQAFLQTSKPIVHPQRFLKQLLQDGHAAILERGMRQAPPVNPRTTAVVALVQSDEVIWAHVGDSRCYLFRQGELLVRTVDHSLAEAMPCPPSSGGGLSLSGLVSRHLITRCLGGSLTPPQISFGILQPLKSQDVLLLCSDGFWGPLRGREMVQALTADRPLATILDDLAREAEARSHQHSDNVTAVALRWEVADSVEPPPARQPVVAVESSHSEFASALDTLRDFIEAYESEKSESPESSESSKPSGPGTPMPAPVQANGKPEEKPE